MSTARQHTRTQLTHFNDYDKLMIYQRSDDLSPVVSIYHENMQLRHRSCHFNN